jgi:hypothetical protein
MEVPDIIVTTVYFIFTLALVDFLRFPTRKLFSSSSPLVQRCAQEFLATFELCVIEYEIGIRNTKILIRTKPYQPFVARSSVFYLKGIAISSRSLVLDQYGLLVYCIYCFLANAWWALRWGLWEGATTAPYTHIEDWLSGSSTLGSAIALIISEILGGMIYYRIYLAPLWTLWNAGQAHQLKLVNESCSSEIQVSRSQVISNAIVLGSYNLCKQ